MNQEYRVTGGGDVRLWAGEWGNPDGQPILLIHGFMQSHISWRAQLDSDLAKEFRLVAIDNRGHGRSDKPEDAAAYQDGQNWADDIAAAIKQLNLDKPVLAGWSYGGLIILDYCQRYGCGDVAGINFVSASVRRMTDPNAPAPPEFRKNLLSDDLPARIDGTRKFLRACTNLPVDRNTFETWLAFNMLVPAPVRRAMLSRELDFDPVLSSLSVPALVTYCTADNLVPVEMGEHAVAKIREAQVSIYQDIGHSPFLEDSAQFNQELADFARSCS